jgi:riboflavin biosynthesis pyrimidine reductase
MKRRLGLTTDMKASSVVASLVVDPAGRVRDGVDSRPLSSPEDRTRFLSLRQHARCIIIGSKTWAAESYQKTKVPLLVYSKGDREIVDWPEEIAQLSAKYGSPILVEAGPTLLEEMMRAGVIDLLHLTRTTRVSEDPTSPVFDFQTLDGFMELIETIEGHEDRFELYRKA